MSVVKHRVTTKIDLRLLEESDAPSLFAIIDANRQYLRQWLPWVDANQEIKHSAAFIQTTQLQFNQGLGLNGAIFYDNKLVGMCGFHNIDQANHTVTIGYWLHPDYQGREIVTQCVKYLIEYAFTKLGLNSIRCGHARNNHQSRSVIERCGFTYEGTYRQAEFLYDHYVDVLWYSILHSEWRSSLRLQL